MIAFGPGSAVAVIQIASSTPLQMNILSLVANLFQRPKTSEPSKSHHTCCYFFPTTWGAGPMRRIKGL